MLNAEICERVKEIERVDKISCPECGFDWFEKVEVCQYTTDMILKNIPKQAIRCVNCHRFLAFP